MGRFVWYPLTVLIALELGLDQVQQAELISAYALGYLLPQVAGGMIADAVGGKSVQTVALLALAGGMLSGPTIADVAGVRGLYWLHLFIGITSGMQQPAYACMVTAWFPQHQLGSVQVASNMHVLMFELAATGIVPLIGSWIGWRQTFIVIGVSTFAYLPVWMLMAQSWPRNRGAKMNGHVNGSKVQESTMPPLRFFLQPPVLSVIFQHMSFCGTKYMFIAWMPQYFNQHYGMGPEQSAGYLSMEKIAGLCASFAFKALEGWIISRRTLTFSRRFFAILAFVVAGLAALAQAILHRQPGLSWAPLLTSILLCINTCGLMSHVVGFRSNYSDLTAKYAGALYGVGTTCATAATYATPLGAAYLMRATDNNWSVLFLSSCAFNWIAGMVFVPVMSAQRLDAGFGAEIKSEGVEKAEKHAGSDSNGATAPASAAGNQTLSEDSLRRRK